MEIVNECGEIYVLEIYLLECGKKNGIITYNQNPKFLGITFDESLSFKIHAENLTILNLTARKWQKNGQLNMLTYLEIV